MKIIPFQPPADKREVTFPKVWAFSADYNQLMVMYGIENIGYAFDDLVYSIYSSLKISFDLNVIEPKFIIWAEADSHKETSQNSLGEKRQHIFYVTFFEFYEEQLQVIKHVVDESDGWNSVGVVTKLPPFVFPMYEYAMGSPSVFMAKMDSEEFQISPLLVFNPDGISLEFFRQTSPFKEGGNVVLHTSKENYLRCKVKFVQDILPDIGFIQLDEGVFQIRNFEKIHIVPKRDRREESKPPTKVPKPFDPLDDIETLLANSTLQSDPDGLKWYEKADLLDDEIRNRIANSKYLTTQSDSKPKQTPSKKKKPELFTVSIYEMAHLYDGEEYVDHIQGFESLETAIEYARRYVRAQVEEARKNGTKDSIRDGLGTYGEKAVVTGHYDSWNELDYFIEHPATPEQCDYNALNAKNQTPQ